MKLAPFLAIALILFGCTGGPCNPPPILYPVLIPLVVPVAIAARVKEHNRRAHLKPIMGGDSVDRPFKLEGSMSAADLQEEEYLGFWAKNNFQAPGVGVRASSAVVDGRTIQAVVYRDWATDKESCYYFDVTDVHLTETKPTPPSGGTAASSSHSS
ncbi:MAG TPA: hypothetical protein VHD32_03025 [Candidatus Didemnitutus sp.]|nr:hypothetical protein [Candidatus Didemnitutus sp.]